MYSLQWPAVPSDLRCYTATVRATTCTAVPTPCTCTPVARPARPFHRHGTRHGAQKGRWETHAPGLGADDLFSRLRCFHSAAPSDRPLDSELGRCAAVVQRAVTVALPRWVVGCLACDGWRCKEHRATDRRVQVVGSLCVYTDRMYVLLTRFQGSIPFP